MSIDDSSDFSKQRRNLILISGVLILHILLDLNFEEFELLGMGIENYQRVEIIFWVMWVYFLCRYFNLFFEEENIIENTFTQPLKDILFKLQKRIVIKKMGTLSQGMRINQKKESTFFDMQFEVVQADDYGDRDAGTFSAKAFQEINTLKLLPICTLQYLLKKHYFLEYYFPIIFAAIPVFALLIKTLCASAPLW